MADWTAEPTLNSFGVSGADPAASAVMSVLALSRWFREKFYLLHESSRISVLTCLPKGSCCTEADFPLLFL